MELSGNFGVRVVKTDVKGTGYMMGTASWLCGCARPG